MSRRELWELFLVESREQMEAARRALREIRRGGGGPGEAAEVRRHLHSLKGMAATMGIPDLAGLVHALEAAFGPAGDPGPAPSPDRLDRVERGLAEAAELVDRLDAGEAAPWPGGDLRTRPPAPRRAAPDAGPPARKRGRRAALLPGTVRIQTELLDTLLEITAEVLIRSAGRRRTAGPPFADPAGFEPDPLDRALGRLRETVMEIRLVPFATIAGRLQDAARDLADRRGKRLAMTYRGAETPLDRSTLERLVDPLLHLIRNCVDHGLERAAERRRAGKTVRGRLRLRVERAGPEVVVDLEDDGRGMDLDEIRRLAVRGGWLTPPEAARLRPEDLGRLLTRPGFTTAAAADEVSGRGVGMDAVAARIRALGGSLEIRSEPGRGTRFRIRLPLTVGVLDCLLVRAGAGWFAFPLHQVETTVEVREPDPGNARVRHPVVEEREPLPWFSLTRILGVEPVRTEPGTPALVLRAGRDRFVLTVDAIAGRKDLLFRPLGPPLEVGSPFPAAALLENGEIALLLNAASLGGALPADPSAAPAGG